MKSVFLVLLWQIIASVKVEAGLWNRQKVATFDLFDNGASEGSVKISLKQKEFPSGEDDEHSGELFAMKMSQYINVTKYGMEPGTVRSTKAFREDGERIVNFQQLLPDTSVAMRRRIYLVAEGLEFIWPFVKEGYQQVVSSRALTPVYPDKPVILESVSDSPRVFKVLNFFGRTEGQALIDNALKIEGKKGLHRSTVGSKVGAEDEGAQVDYGRTSDNAWDSETPAAKAMITRSFNLTGIEEDAGKIDGLQIVRYTPGKFYNKHPDYFSPSSDPDFNFVPYSGGSNRFATVFMYINDVEEGGCTVFPKADSPNPSEPPEYAIDMFDKNSLEHALLYDCHRKLAVPPKEGTAALFYSVTPDGQLDPMALHGACPVIKGTKWGANIWIWNRQRYGEIKTGEGREMLIRNDMDENIYITWESKPNGELGPGEDLKFNTFEYHRFKAHKGNYKGETISEFTVQSEPDYQEWILKPRRSLGNKNDGLNMPSRGAGGIGTHSEL